MRNCNKSDKEVFWEGIKDQVRTACEDADDARGDNTKEIRLKVGSKEEAEKIAAVLEKVLKEVMESK